MNVPEPKRPPGLSDEEWAIYMSGFRDAMSVVSDGALAFAVTSSNEAADLHGGWDEPDDESDVETCDDCGRKLVQEMGQDEPICVVCD